MREKTRWRGGFADFLVSGAVVELRFAVGGRSVGVRFGDGDGSGHPGGYSATTRASSFRCSWKRDLRGFGMWLPFEELGGDR